MFTDKIIGNVTEESMVKECEKTGVFVTHMVTSVIHGVFTWLVFPLR